MAEITNKEEKKLKKTVEEIVAEIAEGGSPRFSNSEFRTLVFAILSDPSFNAEKWILQGDELVSTTDSISAEMRKFLNKLLKHAGMSNADERDAVIDSFEYGPNDIAFIVDAVDEAMYQYTECGKNLSLFRNKIRRMAVKKVNRTGKYEGKVTYKKTVTDRLDALNRSKKAKAKAAETAE